MATVFDVANFFVEWANKSEEEHMGNLRLNKLLFYSQGQHLARYGKPLFNDPIEAWVYGPVVPPIYQKYKVCGKNPITTVDEDYKASVFSRDEQLLLSDVLRTYGPFTAGTLVSMTHQPGTPWRNAYIDGRNTEITQASMMEFFKEPRNAMQPFRELFSVDNLDAIGARDADGFLVLPCDGDEDDDWDEL